MRLKQLDRIIEIEDDQLTAVKSLSLSEEYLKDHFPRFPVMPGVLMVESIYQAAMYLVRVRDDFSHSMVVLRETKNIKFGDFVEPGNQLVVHVKIKSEADSLVTIQVKATTGGATAVRGQIVLEKYNLADRQMAPKEVDDDLRFKFRKRFERLCGPNYCETGKPDPFVVQ